MGQRSVTSRRMRCMAAVAGAVLIAVSCSSSRSGTRATSTSAAEATTPPTDAGGTGTTLSAAAWAADLEQLDKQVRNLHPNPFAIHSEAEWTAKLAELRTTLPNANDDEQHAQLASLVALLDTHSLFGGRTKGDAPLAFHFYQLQLYGFSEGWYVIRAKNPVLVGMKLVSIGGAPMTKVITKMATVIPADNQSGKLNGLGNWLTAVEYLHGLGIVKDKAAPAFVLQRADGKQLTVNPDVSSDEFAWENDVALAAPPPGKAPEAIVRRAEQIWTRVDAANHTFLLSYNDYGDLTDALAAMRAALDSGAVDRVVVDMRYLPGGRGNAADPLLSALQSDPRINQDGKLVVMIGRMNESAGTEVAAKMDNETKAIIVGEPTPARADNFLCSCTAIQLTNSGFVVEVPTQQSNNHDTRDAVIPDVEIDPSAEAYFAGEDPVLQAALTGTFP